MLPPAESPIHTLVFPWWIGEAVEPKDVPALRHNLVAAMFLEAPKHAADYDIFTDHRVRWAISFLQFRAGDIPAIPADTTAAASWVFDPPLTTDHKSRAANDDAA